MTNKHNTPNNCPCRTDINCPNMHQAMKGQGQLAVQCYSLLTSAHGNEWSALCQGHFTLKTRTPGTEWTQR